MLLRQIEELQKSMIEESSWEGFLKLGQFYMEIKNYPLAQACLEYALLESYFFGHKSPDAISGETVSNTIKRNRIQAKVDQILPVLRTLPQLDNKYHELLNSFEDKFRNPPPYPTITDEDKFHAKWKRRHWEVMEILLELMLYSGNQRKRKHQCGRDICNHVKNYDGLPDI